MPRSVLDYANSINYSGSISDLKRNYFDTQRNRHLQQAAEIRKKREEEEKARSMQGPSLPSGAFYTKDVTKSDTSFLKRRQQKRLVGPRLPSGEFYSKDAVEGDIVPKEVQGPRLPSGHFTTTSYKRRLENDFIDRTGYNPNDMKLKTIKGSMTGKKMTPFSRTKSKGILDTSRGGTPFKEPRRVYQIKGKEFDPMFKGKIDNYLDEIVELEIVGESGLMGGNKYLYYDHNGDLQAIDKDKVIDKDELSDIDVNLHCGHNINTYFHP